VVGKICWEKKLTNFTKYSDLAGVFIPYQTDGVWRESTGCEPVHWKLQKLFHMRAFVVDSPRGKVSDQRIREWL
jgi:hypothetical protein